MKMHAITTIFILYTGKTIWKNVPKFDLLYCQCRRESSGYTIKLHINFKFRPFIGENSDGKPLSLLISILPKNDSLIDSGANKGSSLTLVSCRHDFHPSFGKVCQSGGQGLKFRGKPREVGWVNEKKTVHIYLFYLLKKKISQTTVEPRLSGMQRTRYCAR